jgi:hypothetical protein
LFFTQSKEVQASINHFSKRKMDADFASTKRKMDAYCVNKLGDQLFGLI